MLQTSGSEALSTTATTAFSTIQPSQVPRRMTRMSAALTPSASRGLPPVATSLQRATVMVRPQMSARAHSPCGRYGPLPCLNFLDSHFGLTPLFLACDSIHASRRQIPRICSLLNGCDFHSCASSTALLGTFVPPAVRTERPSHLGLWFSSRVIPSGSKKYTPYPPLGPFWGGERSWTPLLERYS